MIATITDYAKLGKVNLIDKILLLFLFTEKVICNEQPT